MSRSTSIEERGYRVAFSISAAGASGPKDPISSKRRRAGLPDYDCGLHLVFLVPLVHGEKGAVGVDDGPRTGTFDPQRRRSQHLSVAYLIGDAGLDVDQWIPAHGIHRRQHSVLAHGFDRSGLIHRERTHRGATQAAQ